MNGKEYRKSARARRTIAGIFAACILTILALLVFGVYPLRRAELRINREMAEVKDGIAEFRAQAGEASIEKRLAAARAANSEMKADWDRLEPHVNTFSKEEKLADILASSEEGRIDYKVALFDARQWIDYQSRNNNTVFPPDLGMKETVGTEEVMESKLWQLAANVSLAEVVISSGMDAVESIDVLDPITRAITIGEHPYLMLYPVRVEMRGSYSDMLDFIRKIGGEERFFAPLRLLVENIDPSRSDLLAVRAVCAALLFKDELPGGRSGEQEPPPDPDEQGEAYEEEGWIYD